MVNVSLCYTPISSLEKDEWEEPDFLDLGLDFLEDHNSFLMAGAGRLPTASDEHSHPDDEQSPSVDERSLSDDEQSLDRSSDEVEEDSREELSEESALGACLHQKSESSEKGFSDASSPAAAARSVRPLPEEHRSQETPDESSKDNIPSPFDRNGPAVPPTGQIYLPADSQAKSSLWGQRISMAMYVWERGTRLGGWVEAGISGGVELTTSSVDTIGLCVYRPDHVVLITAGATSRTSASDARLRTPSIRTTTFSIRHGGIFFHSRSPFFSRPAHGQPPGGGSAEEKPKNLVCPKSHPVPGSR